MNEIHLPKHQNHNIETPALIDRRMLGVELAPGSHFMYTELPRE